MADELEILSGGDAPSEAPAEIPEVETPSPEPVAESEPVAEEPLGDESGEAPPPADDGIEIDDTDDLGGTPKPEAVAQAPKTPEQQADEALEDQYRRHPEWRELFRQNPELRTAFFSANALVKEFPGGVKDAQLAKEQAVEFNRLEEMYYSGSRDGMKNFIDEIKRNGIDPATGQSLGTYEVFQELVTGNVMGTLATLLESNPVVMAKYANVSPEVAKRATQIVAQMLGVNLPGGAQAQPGVQLPAGQPTNPQLDERVAQRQRTLDEREAKLSQSEYQTFTNNTVGQFQVWLQNDVARRLAPAQAAIDKLPPLMRDSIQSTILSRVKSAMQSDKYFESQLNAVTRKGGRDEEHQSRVVSALKERARQEISGVVRSVLEGYGLKIAAMNKEKSDRQAAAASRKEPVSQAGPGRVATPQSKPTSGSAPRKTAVNGSYDKYANQLLGIG